MTDAAYKAKKWLNRLIDLYNNAENTRRAIEVCESRLNSGVSNYENTGRGHTDPIVRQQKREDLLIEYSELQKQYELQEFEFVRQEIITLNVIECLDDSRARAILIDKHLNHTSIKEMGKKGDYGLKTRQLFNAYRVALEMLGAIMEREEPQAIQKTDNYISEYRKRATA